MGRRKAYVLDADDLLLTVAEVADTMRVSNMTIYRLIKSGELPALRVGKNYRIRHSDVQRFLEDRSVRTEHDKGG
jgi:excisionase family DNA binding protein